MKPIGDIYQSSTITKPLTEYNKENKTIARELGCVHGLFDEESYRWFIQNKKLELYYEEGYLAGIDKKSKMSKEELEKEKDIWLKIVAAADSVNGFENRVLSLETQEVYLKHFYDYYQLDIESMLDLEYQKEIQEELKQKTNK